MAVILGTDGYRYEVQDSWAKLPPGMEFNADVAAVAERVVAAAEAMRRDGWWWQNPALTNKAIRRRVLRELLQAWWTTSSIGSTSSPRSRWSGARQ